ncbi:hypothetical protein Aperf_G00000074211 [Anoplocephala perfoliata]
MSSAICPGKHRRYQSPRLERFRGVANIAESDFVVIKENAARGRFGTVALVEYKKKPAAVKRLCTRDLEYYCREARIPYECNHPNILRIFGAGPNIESLDLQYFVFEWATNGDLKRVIDDKIPYNVWHIMLWCSHIASGLHYLHTHTPYIVIHRDLKPSNMLLFEDYTLLKISDFGSSRTITLDKENDLSKPVSTKKFIAPEGRKRDKDGKFKYGEKMDIYSFGQSLRCLLERSSLLDANDDASINPPYLTNLISLCTSDDPNNRPSAEQLVGIFDPIMEIVYADSIERLKIETPGSESCEIDDDSNRTMIPDGEPQPFDMRQLPWHLRPRYISETKDPTAYQEYVKQAEKYVKLKGEIETLQNTVDNLLSELILKSRVTESDQEQIRKFVLQQAEK